MTDCLHSDPAKRPTFEELDTRLRRMDPIDVELLYDDPSSNASKPAQNQRTVAKKRYNMLSQVFPPKIQEALNEGRKVESEERAVVTVVFVDIVNFDAVAATLSAKKISHLLDRLYHRMDLLSQKHEVLKIETLKDSWIGATNLVKDQAYHAKHAAEFAIDVVKVAKSTLIDIENPSMGCVKLKLGFHSGPCVVDVVGRRNRKLFCLLAYFCRHLRVNSEPIILHIRRPAFAALQLGTSSSGKR